MLSLIIINTFRHSYLGRKLWFKNSLLLNYNYYETWKMMTDVLTFYACIENFLWQCNIWLHNQWDFFTNKFPDLHAAQMICMRYNCLLTVGHALIGGESSSGAETSTIDSTEGDCEVTEQFKPAMIYVLFVVFMGVDTQAGCWCTFLCIWE